MGLSHIGRRGSALRRQRIYGKCGDCKETDKLIGFLCERCYDRRARKYKYQTDAGYRIKCKERNRINRERGRMT
jgi:hypothetical protein